jgi:hypothetical protein
MELNGLLAIWTDIDRDFIPAFREWHSREHMALRIGTPGWYVGHRYQGIGRAPGFLIAYETRSAEDLAGKGYHGSLNQPDARTREALSHYRNSIRTIYRLVKGAGPSLPTDAHCYVALRCDIPASRETTLARIADAHLPDMVKVPGVSRARLYEIDQSVSDIMTEERKLYAAGPGKQPFLLTYELARPEVLDSREWCASFPRHTSDGLRIDHHDVFALEFTIYPPGKDQPR